MEIISTRVRALTGIVRSLVCGLVHSSVLSVYVIVIRSSVRLCFGSFICFGVVAVCNVLIVAGGICVVVRGIIVAVCRAFVVVVVVLLVVRDVVVFVIAVGVYVLGVIDAVK